MIYFDNAATGGRKPQSVIEAVKACIDGICANPGRSGHALSVAQAQQIFRCRKLLCEFFDGESAERVILTKNCTEALNFALFGTVFGCKNDDTYPQIPHVITTAAEHNSVLRPLLFLERQGKISLTIAPLSNGEISLQNIARSVRDNTIAAVVTLASNVTGAAVDAARLRALLPERIYLICDGAQACGHIPVSLKKFGIDALAVAGHKGMHGIQGSGALIFSKRLNLAPTLYGGTGSNSADPDMPDFYPDRLEAGTISCPAAASLAEGVLYLMPKLRANAAKIEKFTKLLIDGLNAIKNLRIYSRPNPFGIVAFTCKTLPSEFFAQALSDEYSIAVRVGLHCAPLMHRQLNTFETGAVRVSLSEFNTENEINSFLFAAESLAKSN